MNGQGFARHDGDPPLTRGMSPKGDLVFEGDRRTYTVRKHQRGKWLIIAKLAWVDGAEMDSLTLESTEARRRFAKYLSRWSTYGGGWWSPRCFEDDLRQIAAEVIGVPEVGSAR
jgi:hypothetical protein